MLNVCDIIDVYEITKVIKNHKKYKLVEIKKKNIEDIEDIENLERTFDAEIEDEIHEVNEGADDTNRELDKYVSENFSTSATLLNDIN